MTLILNYALRPLQTQVNLWQPHWVEETLESNWMIRVCAPFTWPLISGLQKQ